MAWTKEQRAAHCQQIGGLGGKKTAETYGKRYMAELGKIGFQAYADNHHGGNRAAARASLGIMTSPNVRVRQPGTFR